MKTLLLLSLAVFPLLAPTAQAAEADLKASDGSAIRITFDPAGGTGTPGSSAVSFYAANVRVEVTVPWADISRTPVSALAKLLAVTKDGAYVDQYITLLAISALPSGARYTGLAPYPLLIKSYDSGQEHRYQQYLEVDLIYADSRYNRVLVNPIGDSTRFETDLAAAEGQ